ncbi:SIMPL domain-containing protein [Microbacterium sp. cx-55]|uniref:SIMPL domain-containing protein n=1 Tax=Microbacterium sp. cx-55 TaxID=2875948 RepID=UPI001CBFCA5D|nr:SIMPL domain-containing protein [Microbacterium sp. cx-55]MBZ4486025.1 SIMPL domain-containing protein [Microbacterium sp. cx-55]UGB34103.1 SIMPL domain-containing protein [Microbacterium sp. cx-55]
MSDVTITVRGEHEERLAAEVGIVRATIRVEGSDRPRVIEELAEIAHPVRADLDARRESGALLRWTSSRANVWTERPWAPDGAKLDPVHHASVEITANFADPAALSAWVDEVSILDGTQIDAVTWELSELTAGAARDRVAASAVLDAVNRAAAYASALALSSVTPVAIADVGLLGGDGTTPSSKLMRSMAADAGGVDLRPEDVVVSAAVDARFIAH